jgi:broad specificity phosphatase PhoE
MRLTTKPFYFLRHGQTDWNAQSLCVGQADVPLNREGIAQARKAAKIVRGTLLGTIFCSTLGRAERTAWIIADRRTPVIPQPGLCEVCFGVKEGLPEDNPHDDFVAAWLSGLAIEGAEPFHRFRDRVVAAVNDCLAWNGVAPPLIVAHCGVFLALAHECGSRLTNIDHCRPYHFMPTQGGWAIHRVGE